MLQELAIQIGPGFFMLCTGVACFGLWAMGYAMGKGWMR